MTDKQQSEQEFLKTYSAEKYARPSAACDIAVFSVMETPEKNYRKLPEKELCLLLIRRGKHPFLGQWALPGGFIQPDETAHAAAKRELFEETNVNAAHIEQLFSFTDPRRDPRTWVISIAHLALLDATALPVSAGDDADMAQWFRCKTRQISENAVTTAEGCTKTHEYEIALTSGDIVLRCKIQRETAYTPASTETRYTIAENNGLAFDHAHIIACALDRLKGKLEYTSIALQLMPPRFTLTELQQVYEAILEKPLLKPAFRRKIADLVKETEEYTTNAGHRPSRLFTRNWEGISRL